MNQTVLQINVFNGSNYYLCLLCCQQLGKLYQPIHLVTLNPKAIARIYWDLPGGLQQFILILCYRQLGKRSSPKHLLWTVALIPVYLLDLPGGSVIEHLVVLVRERLPYGVKVRVDGHRCLKYYIIQTLFTGKKTMHQCTNKKILKMLLQEST